MTAASHHYTDGGGAYHDLYKDLFAVQAASTHRILGPHMESSDTVLDFGCADGSLLAALPNGRKMGVEVNPVSREKALARGLDVFDSVDAIADDSVDVVVSSHVLEHTLKPLDEIVSLRRTLRSGGRLLLLLPIDDWRAQKRWALPEPNHHLYTWTPQLLANLLSEAGYRVRSIDVLTYTLPGRFTTSLQKRLPTFLFDLVARAVAVARRRRQLVAVAEAS